ncbi:hypothetical protein PybrP1_004865 [[Pythium] brassicae (nom. inval.)]|nr:hypothetical protein PybrP1_004865 [[Pythium] brassicae (nom. inval.)]
MHLDIATVNVWVDRLHHYLYRFVKKTTRWRLHSIHSYTKASTDAAEVLDVCLSTRRRRPMFCDSLNVWWCSHPVNASLPKVPIWDHINLRISVLQRKYPDLSLDVTIFDTINPTTSTVSLILAFFEAEVLEIVVLTRGRRCYAQPTTSCVTVFVDDYRYERGILSSNIAEWYSFTAALRATAQVYVWVRLTLLFGVAYRVESPNTSRAARAASALRTVSKIPFQVVVYGSLFPVVSYVVAHLIDCSFVDLYLETYWATVNGVANFDVLTFARHASVQMRNVWVIALGTKAGVFVWTRLMPSWQPRDGIAGVRGLAISLCSLLSVFGPFRSLSFRDSSVVSVLALGMEGRGGRRMQAVRARPVSLFNVSMEGLPKDMKMTLFAIFAVILLALDRRANDCEPLHDRALRLEERTVEINSAVRLINLAMMTDPWTLFRLRVFGCEVYFYEQAAEVDRLRQ